MYLGTYMKLHSEKNIFTPNVYVMCMCILPSETFLHDYYFEKLVSQVGLPDFYLYNIPKRGKCIKLPENIPNGYKT
jgi:hypothetical protein